MSGNIISERWDSYGKTRDGVFMFLSFDDEAADGDQPGELDLCARIIIPINECKPGSTLPVESEGEFLYGIEDEIVDSLAKENVPCRLVARLTYDGLREIVFQVGDADAFRPPVGNWIQQHATHEIDVSEHDGWDFFNEYICPTSEDRRAMAEHRVIDNLLENGSNPELEHDLEYCFDGDEVALRKIAEKLKEKNYKSPGELDFSCGQITMSISMPLDRPAILDESRENAMIATDCGGSLNGWGALTRSS